MKICPSCGSTSPDDADFCIKCGAYFEKPAEPAKEAPRVAHKIPMSSDQVMEEGFREMSGDDFAGAVAKWSEAIKGGQQVDDATYDRMLAECVDSVMRTTADPGTHSRQGISGLALLLDDRDLMTDMLQGMAERSKGVGTQRELMNIANEYMFLAIESFSVYTDLEDLEAICIEAAAVMRDMHGRIDGLEPVQSKNDPKAFLENYAQFFDMMASAIRKTIDSTDPATLEWLSDYWATRDGSRFSDIVIGAANMNAQLIGTGWLGGKVAVKARDMQIEGFIHTYTLPSKQKQ